jgi:hypothetical protein
VSSKRILATVAMVCGVLSLAPAAAPADKPGPFMPFRAADFDLPAGARCPFALSGRVQVDRERIRTTQTNPDGTPRQQQVVGKLVVRYINMDSGASVDRNLTGNALIDHHPDGSFTFTLQSGHLAVGLAATDPGGPAFLVLKGHGFSVDFAASGLRTVHFGKGTVENICQTLA